MKKVFLVIISLAVSFYVSAQEKQNFPTEKELTLKTTNGNLSGSLTFADTTKKTPVVLIIAGSGPTDRNGNNYMGLKTNTYKMLADEFAKNGISCLRYDKRGVAKSLAATVNENKLRFETYVNDAKDWISYLAKQNRFSKIIVLGHSEGSLIGMLACINNNNVSEFISVAGAGKPIDEIIRKQLQGKVSPELIEESNKILDSLKAGVTVPKINPALWSLYRPSVQPYMISWIKYNPQKEIQKLKIPVLIVQGTTDIQVSTENAELLAKAKPDANLLIIENMNHVLKKASNDLKENTTTYNNPDLPLKKELIPALLSFIKSVK